MAKPATLNLCKYPILFLSQKLQKSWQLEEAIYRIRHKYQDAPSILARPMLLFKYLILVQWLQISKNYYLNYSNQYWLDIGSSPISLLWTVDPLNLNALFNCILKQLFYKKLKKSKSLYTIFVWKFLGTIKFQ